MKKLLFIILFTFFSVNIFAQNSMVYKSIKKGDIEVLTINSSDSDNQLTKKEVEEFFINSQNEPMIISTYDNYGPAAEGELLYKGKKVKYEINRGGWGTIYAPIKNVDDSDVYTAVCNGIKCKPCADISSFIIYDDLINGSFNQSDVENIKQLGKTQCIGNKDDIEINILKVFEAGYLLPDYNNKNKDDKTKIKDLFFMSFIYFNLLDKNNTDKNQLKTQIDFYNDKLSTLSLNNTEKILYKNLLELSYNFIGINTALTNIDKYSDNDFYVKYRILLTDYYIKKKNKENNIDKLYNDLLNMIESKKNVMINDYKSKKTSFDYYNLYSNLLRSIKNKIIFP